MCIPANPWATKTSSKKQAKASKAGSCSKLQLIAQPQQFGLND